MGDYAVRADGRVVANGNLPKNFCSRTDVDVIANYRYTSAFAPPANTDGDIMGEVAVYPNDHFFIGNYPPVVPDVKTRSDIGFEGDGDAIFDLETVIHQPGKREKDAPERLSMGISAEPHPPGIAVAWGEQVVIEAVFEGGAA